jgi:methionyl-tRNA synthetase
VIYVWVDALANYLTGLGYPDDGQTFERYWPAALHLVGKEIIRFHCLYWPALLLAAGLPLPRRVFAHGWLTQGGSKISKSTGNIVDPRALAAEFGSDAVRYFFLRAIPFGQDGDFTRAAIGARYNADLANDFGNLVQRATTLASRHPLVTPAGGVARPVEHHLRDRAAQLSEQVSQAFETLALHEAAAAVGSFVSDVNRYIDATAPWTLARDGDSQRLSVALAHIVESTRLAAWHYAPILPRAATEAHCRLAGTAPAPGGDVFNPDRRGEVSVGPPLFPRLLSSMSCHLHPLQGELSER